MRKEMKTGGKRSIELEIRELENYANIYRKKAIFLIIITFACLFGQIGYGQNYELVVRKKIKTGDPSDHSHYGHKNIIQLSDSSFIVGDDTRLKKYSKDFNLVWSKLAVDTNSRSQIITVNKTKTNGFILCSTNRDSSIGNTGHNNSSVSKIDSVGNIVWNKIIYADGDDNAVVAKEILNEDIIVAINSNSPISGMKTFSQNGGTMGNWIICFDKNGNLKWQKTFDTSDFGLVSDIQIRNNDSSILLFGEFNKIKRIDYQGNLITTISFPPSSLSVSYSIISTQLLSNDNLVVAGHNFSTTGGGGQASIWLFDSNLVLIKNIDFKKNLDFSGINATKLSVKKRLAGGYYYGFGNRNFFEIGVLTDSFVILSKSEFYDEHTLPNSVFREVFPINDSDYYAFCVVNKYLNNVLFPNRFFSNNGDFEHFYLTRLSKVRHKIKGYVFPDFNSNCIFNSNTEYNIKNLLILNSKENIITTSNDSSYYSYSWDSDTAVLKIINLDSNLYIACGKDSIMVNMTGKTDTSGIDFPIRSNKTGHCINITSFSSGLLRPGRWGDYQLNYQNNAFDTAYNAYIEIEVDTAAIDSIKSPYSFTLIGNVLRFNLGHVRPFGFSSATYSIKLKTTVIIGSSHCHRAKVFPICNLYPSTVYDSSEIQPMMRCLPNDTVEFTLKNIGLKDQKDWGYSIIYVDELILKTDSFKLTVGNSRIFKYKLDTNKVFTAEVFNSNFHPVTPILIRHNDLCANRRQIIPQNAALNFSRHDEAKEYEEACTIVRGSYDPNIKSVQPVGMFAEHYTATGTELKYRIDFQNTGTDTAFRVVLVDTLSPFLNIASFVPGVSSHPYSVEFGGRAVKFIFDPIKLIDSGKNEPASHGYVHFKIKHIAGISPKTKIENKADIYFDYNAPVRTNTVFNTIFDTIQIYVPKAGDTSKGKDSTSSIQGVNQTSILVFPNPTTDKFFIQMSEPVKDLFIEMYDMQGRFIKSVSSANNQTVEVSAQGMTKGIYHIRCMSREKLILVKKVKVE